MAAKWLLLRVKLLLSSIPVNEDGYTRWKEEPTGILHGVVHDQSDCVVQGEWREQTRDIATLWNRQEKNARMAQERRSASGESGWSGEEKSKKAQSERRQATAFR